MEVKGNLGKARNPYVERQGPMATATKTKKVNLKDLVDIPTAAGLVFVQRHTLENWLSQGILTRFKVRNGKTLISKTELLGLIRKAE
jgi:hypothetical protein